jgi:hypothetical protein
MLIDIKFSNKLHQSNIRFANKSVAVYSTRKNYVEAFTRTLLHLEFPQVHPHAQIYLFHREDLPLNFILPSVKFGHYEDQEISFMHNTVNNSIEIFDKRSLKFFILSSDFDKFIETISISNLHYLKQILNRLGYVNMHGAVVGRNNMGVFLSNKGGSGKSSLMAYAVSKGMQTLGDDFLTLEHHDLSTFYSLFSHLKLHHTSPAFNVVQNSFDSMGEQHDGKKIFKIPGELLQKKMKIKEILIPFIGKKIQVSEISEDEALKRLLPSTLILNHANVLTISTVKKMIKLLPVYLLELNSDLELACQLIEKRSLE